jgi:hypothetical protein
MRTIIVLGFTFCIRLIAFPQTNAVQNNSPANTNTLHTCAIIYSPNNGSLIFKAYSANPCLEIIIESLPPLSQASTEFFLELFEKGSYSFKATKGLAIPGNYTVVIEDIQTGNVFDLRSSEPHSFSLNRAMTKRFVMKINKTNPSASIPLTSG